MSTSQETQEVPLSQQTVSPRTDLSLADCACQLGTQGLWGSTQFIPLSSRANNLKESLWELDGQDLITQCFLQEAGNLW